MTLRFLRIWTAIALALAAPFAIAADVYKVSAQISYEGAAIGSPVLLVDNQSQASVAISGENGYEFAVGLKRVEDGDEIEVAVQLKTSQGSVSSMVTTRVGRPTSIAAGDIGLSVTVTRDDS